jgi:hypothetical protein
LLDLFLLKVLLKVESISAISIKMTMILAKACTCFLKQLALGQAYAMQMKK